MKTLISTDTSCLINNEVLNKYDINVFALNVIVDGKEYLDGITITQDELRDAMRSNKDIKTSTPPLGDVIEYFEKLFSKGYERIIHFTISSKLSSMYDLFCNVAKQHFEGRLFIVDSYALSTVMLSQVFLAYDMAKQDLPTEEILSSLEQRKLDSYIVFIPENLNALKNGGRISPAVALIGNVLGIKPVIVLKNGALEKENSTKHVRRTFLEAIDVLKNTMPVDEYDYTLVNFDGKPDCVNYILAGMGEKLGDENYLQGIVPINVCAHCGPGTIGLMVSKKINGKSIKEYL